MTNSAGSDYWTTEVMTAAPQKLQLMLIEGAIRLVHQARGFRQAGQDDAASTALLRCQQIVTTLLAGISPEHSSDLTRQVASVYLFVYRRLIAANLEQDDVKLGEALAILEIERETWSLLCQQLGATGGHQSPGLTSLVA